MKSSPTFGFTFTSSIWCPLIFILILPSGNLNGSDVDNIETQENVIKQCINELEKSEAVRVDLVSQLREALQDQVWFHFMQVCSSIIYKPPLGSA